MSKIIAIAAMDRNRVIGSNGRLPWRLKDDLVHFKRITTGCPLVMGRKTYESLPGTLPNRVPIVVTRNPQYRVQDGAHVTSSVIYALRKACEVSECRKNVYVIGGGEIYRECIDIVDELLITEVDAEVEGDTTFPDIDHSKWSCTSVQEYMQNDRNEYAFSIRSYRKCTST